MSASWKAIQVSGGQEAFAAAEIQRKAGLESLVFLERVMRMCGQRERAVARAFFPGYVFARWHDGDQWPDLRKIGAGTVQILMSSGQPAIIADEHIEAIRDLCEQHAQRALGEAQRRILPGQYVVVSTGCHAGMRALVEADAGDRIIILTRMFGRDTRASVLRADIEG